MEIYDSNRKGKRFTAVFADGKTVHFGQDNPKYGTFIDHGDTAQRAAYIARHRVREDWTNSRTAGTLSRFILWGDSPDIRQNIAEFRRRFRL